MFHLGKSTRSSTLLASLCYDNMFTASPGPRSSGLRTDRGHGGRGDVPACTCVSAEGARTRAAAESSPVSGRSWMSCLWCSEGTNKHRMRAEGCSLIGFTKQIVSTRGRHDWTNKNRKPQRGSDWENRKHELCFLSHCGSLCKHLPYVNICHKT